MNRLLIILIAPWLCGALRAQVDIDLAFNRESFLPGEPVEVATRFANFTGGPLKLGSEPGWLQFTVEGVDGRVVTKLADPQESGEFTLEQSTRGKLRWNLTPLFGLDDAGTYRVFASVRLPDGEVHTSKPATFEIVTGVALHEPREVGVKLPDGTIDRRKFILQQVNFMKKVQLYLRITDQRESKTLSITPLGTTVSFDRPQWIVDRETRFHVLHRVNNNLYAYHIFRGDGEELVRQIWEGDPRADLQIVNDSGEVGVKGGKRRPDRSDIPSPSTTNSVASVLDSKTGAPATQPPEVKKNDVPSTPP